MLPFVSSSGGQLVVDGQPFTFVGLNFWHAPWIAHSDPAKLRTELDLLHAAGARVLRITALSEGPDEAPLQAVPTHQPRPGVFNEAMFRALDLVLDEMRARGMRAILCLNNMWSWSGGFAMYLVWARGGTWRDIPYPSSHLSGYWDARPAGQRPQNTQADWNVYQEWASAFYSSPRAVALADEAVRRVVARTNAISGLDYAADGTILAWELCNEPRAVAPAEARTTARVAYLAWVRTTAAKIKQLSPRQLVAVGSEGTTPFEEYINVDFDATHALREIDVVTIHVWAQNWDWGDASGKARFESALNQALPYIEDHAQRARTLRKPLVIEEFGFARDMQSYDPQYSTMHRDAYYAALVRDATRLGVSGVMPWAWSGKGRPRVHGGYWRPGDDFLGDPPHEPQGWYSIYDTDESTLRLLREGRSMHATPPTPPWSPTPPSPPPEPVAAACHSDLVGDINVEACEGWCSDTTHCVWCKCRGCGARIGCGPPAAARTCHSAEAGDFDYEACEAWCQPETAPEHCGFCKCRGCPAARCS